MLPVDASKFIVSVGLNTSVSTKAKGNDFFSGIPVESKTIYSLSWNEFTGSMQLAWY